MSAILEALADIGKETAVTIRMIQKDEAQAITQALIGKAVIEKMLQGLTDAIMAEAAEHSHTADHKYH